MQGYTRCRSNIQVRCGKGAIFVSKYISLYVLLLEEVRQFHITMVFGELN